jgi:hypothetical protein
VHAVGRRINALDTEVALAPSAFRAYGRLTAVLSGFHGGLVL